MLNIDEIGGFPVTGESNVTSIIIGLCAVFIILLAGLLWLRCKPRKAKCDRDIGIIEKILQE